MRYKSCKNCVECAKQHCRDTHADWRAANREYNLARMRDWHARNKAYVAATKRKWYEENREYRLAYARDYRYRTQGEPNGQTTE